MRNKIINTLLLPLSLLGAGTTAAQSHADFKKLPSGLEYKIVKHGKSDRKAKMGEQVEITMHVHDGDSVMFDSRVVNHGEPLQIPFAQPKFHGDVMEGLGLMSPGDSALFLAPVDTFKKLGMPLPPVCKEGDMIQYEVVMLSILSESEIKAHQQAKEEKQKATEDKALQDYFEKNHIKPKKTASGMYYTIEREGTGEKIKAGLNVSVNYTGMFIDGKKFDSNTDPDFHHVQAFDLKVGSGHVIKGWDEGLTLLKKGSKATLYIPSPLAYGSTGRGQQMPPNSTLIFNIEVVDVMTDEQKKEADELKKKEAEAAVVKQAQTDDKILQDYFAKNNIKATKTPSGLYYRITDAGTGDNAAPGNKVSMKYTGKTLDGKSFDSNVDPAFHHTEPFTFTLGQHQVIAGWDEGIALLKTGSKGTLYIPSGLAYGPTGNSGIAPNAILMFDVEVVGIDKK